MKIQNLITNENDPLDNFEDVPEKDVISKPGDIWQLGNHIIYCGDSLLKESYDILMEEKKARMIFTDPPYNVKIYGHVCGLGKVQHAEFKMASGEMSSSEFITFLENIFNRLKAYSVDGSLHYICMDWRHIIELTTSANKVYTEMKNLCIWNKASGGMAHYIAQNMSWYLSTKTGQPHTLTILNLANMDVIELMSGTMQELTVLEVIRKA